MSDMYDKKTRLPFGQHIRRREDGSLDVGTVNKEVTMTQQQYAEECDVNHIMKKYITTGEIHHVNRKQGVYADMADIQDYQGMLNTVLAANEAFDALPADVRNKFRNDPANLIEFVQDPENYDEGVKLGLFEGKIQRPEALNKNDLNDNKPATAKSKKSEPAPKNQPDEE